MGNAKRGFFITLEGGEGSGKSTNISVAADFMKSCGYEVICTREPGGTRIAEQIRSILLKKDPQEELCAISELLLMYASRAQLVNSLILPALNEGKVVISDRFDLSTVAYQGAGRGFDLHLIDKLRQIAIGSFIPDLTLVFDVDVNIGLERARQRGKLDRIEQESVEFFERIRNCYCAYALQHTNHVVMIDGSKTPDEVAHEVRSVLQQQLQVTPL